MIGSVHYGEAILPLRVRGPRGTIEPIEAILDTGFNDWLTLSPSQIVILELAFREEGRYVLADGSEAVSRLFEAEIEWVGQWRRILVVEMDGGPLVGMATLRGCHLDIDVVENGRVEIRPLG
jgi:predicted aspartyl protease